MTITEQDAATAATLATVERFNDALNRHDIDAVMALMTDDCVFENTYPAPDGERHVGQQAIRSFWTEMLRGALVARFSTEEIFAVGDRCTVRWRYGYTSSDGQSGHIRGADVFRIRDNQVAAKFAYVRG